jgi:Polyketide cyclase / dehydrase and lipid transport
MHLFECEATFEAEPAEVWKVWTDVERWPEWDVSKEIAQLDGPFQPGVSGWAKQRGNLGGSFTITVVDDGRRWVTECPIPLGKVVFDHLLEPAAEGHVRVVKKVEVHGGFGSLLRLIAPRMRRDITQSLAALERQLSALGTRTHGHQDTALARARVQNVMFCAPWLMCAKDPSANWAVHVRHAADKATT